MVPHQKVSLVIRYFVLYLLFDISTGFPNNGPRSNRRKDAGVEIDLFPTTKDFSQSSSSSAPVFHHHHDATSSTSPSSIVRHHHHHQTDARSNSNINEIKEEGGEGVGDEEEEDHEESELPEDKIPFLSIEKHLTNITKESGEHVTLKCEFRSNHDDAVRVAWFKNEAPVEILKGKLDIKTHITNKGTILSKLKIHNLDVHDMGFYKCEATVGNNLDHNDISQESIGVLKVEGGSYMSSQSIPPFNPEIPDFPGLFAGRQMM